VKKSKRIRKHSSILGKKNTVLLTNLHFLGKNTEKGKGYAVSYRYSDWKHSPRLKPWKSGIQPRVEETFNRNLLQCGTHCTVHSGVCILKNHRGTYLLQQFHLHWGQAGSGIGSEHTVDEEAANAELHFVLTKKDAEDKDQKDYITVVGMLLHEEDSLDSLDPWAKLDVGSVHGNLSQPVNISSFVLSDLLPENKSYYYYQGSPTTPPYNEVVQ